jgi:alpha-galactosidase
MAQHAISQALGLPPEEIDPRAGGLNHFNWILELRRTSTGEDLYPAFKQAMAEQGIEEASIHDHHFGIKLCHYLMQIFGYWPLPSDDHVGEYLSYAWEYCGLDGYDFEAAERRAEENWRRLRRWARGEEPLDELLGHQIGERAVPIITGVLGNTHQYELAVNVPNAGLIPNLPAWAIVEVPATVDATGVHGVPIGPLPEPIAAMCGTQVAIVDRVVEAGVHGDRRAALEALLLDPVVTAVSQAEAILNEMLEVHQAFLPQFQS